MKKTITQLKQELTEAKEKNKLLNLKAKETKQLKKLKKEIRSLNKNLVWRNLTEKVATKENFDNSIKVTKKSIKFIIGGILVLWGVLGLLVLWLSKIEL